MANVSHRDTSGISPTVTAGGYLNALAYGLVADGETDQTAKLNELVAYARANGFGGLQIPDGVTMIGGSTLAHRNGIDLSGITDFAIIGSGPACVLRMTKDFALDRRLVYCSNGSARLRFENLTFDGNWVDESGSEQVHLVTLGYGEVSGGTVDRVTIRNCWFKDCKGDAVRLLGADGGGEITNITVDNCWFSDTRRCGVAVQRGTYDVHVTNNYFETGAGQQLDMEATGESAVGRYIITGNTFDGSNDTATRVLVTIGGYSPTSPNTDSVFADNVVRGRVQLTNVEGLRFTDNQVIPAADESGEPTVNFIRHCRRVVVSGNRFVRDADSAAGACVQFSQNSGVVPDGIVFANNTVVQHTAGAGVLFDGCDNVVAAGNHVEFHSTSSNVHDGIVVDATIGNLDSFTATGNIVIGNLGGGQFINGIHVSARGNVIGRAMVSNNSIEGALIGVSFEKTGGGSFTKYPVCSGNTFASVTTPVVHTAQTIVFGGQQGAGTDLAGYGSPESVVTGVIGSTFRRLDGTTDTAMYIKETGTGNTGWVAVTGATDISGIENDITALDGRLDTAESDISTLEGEVDTLQAAKQKLFLTYSGLVMTAGNTDRYPNPIGHSTSPIGTAALFYTIPVAGNLVAIQYQASTAHTTNTVTIAPRKNGVEETAQKVTLAASTLYQRDVLGTPLAVAVGDYIACQMDHLGATNLASFTVVFEIEF